MGVSVFNMQYDGDGWNAWSGHEAEFETLSESSSGEQWMEIK